MLKKIRNMMSKDRTAENREQDVMDIQTEEVVQLRENDPETEAQPDEQATNLREEVQNQGEDPQALQQQLEELKDKYMRLFAEFDNYKRRSVREKLDYMKTAAQDTLSALLPVLDDFDRAKKFAQKENGSTLSEGVELVYQKLYNILRQKGLEAMDSDGSVFDPELHEAITEIPAPTEDLKGKIVDVIEKGYKLNDKIIRHAKVVVGK
jgi:molecular chaperone GrpE